MRESLSSKKDTKNKVGNVVMIDSTLKNQEVLAKEVKKELKSVIDYKEILVVINLLDGVKNIDLNTDDGFVKAKDILLREISKEGSNLSVTLLVNEYVKKYRGFEVTRGEDIRNYSRLFGGPMFSHKNSTENYLDLLSRLFNSNGKSFNTNLGNVLKTVRKRERDRVKYKGPEDFKNLSKAVVSKLEELNIQLKEVDKFNREEVVGEFIVYDENLKNEIKSDEVSDEKVKKVIKKLYNVKGLVVKTEIVEEVAVTVDTREEIKENIRPEIKKEIKKEIKDEIKDEVKVEIKEEVKSDKLVNGKMEVEKTVENYTFLKKLRAFSLKLTEKDLYKVQDYENFKLMDSVLSKMQETLKDRDGVDLFYSINKEFTDIIVDLRYKGKVERFYITPVFFVNITNKRLYADRTKIIKIKSRNRVTDLEKYYIALIKVLRKLVTGRREKDRLNKDYKEADIRRLNRLNFLLMEETNSTSSPLHQTGIVKDKKGNELVFYKNISGEVYIISPDFIYDVKDRRYIYRRKMIYSTIKPFIEHIQISKEQYKLGHDEYNKLMTKIVNAWNIRKVIKDSKGNKI